MSGYLKLTIREKSGNIINSNVSASIADLLIRKLMLTPENKYEDWLNEIKAYFESISTHIPKKNSSLFCPYGFGIIIVDFQEMKISSNQSYSNLNMMRLDNLLDLISEYGVSMIDDFEIGIKNQKIKAIETINYDQPFIIDPVNMNGKLLYNLIILIEYNYHGKITNDPEYESLMSLDFFKKLDFSQFIGCRLDLNSPFKIAHFNNNIYEIWKILKHDHFVFSEKEEKRWKSFK